METKNIISPGLKEILDNTKGKVEAIVATKKGNLTDIADYHENYQHAICRSQTRSDLQPCKATKYKMHS